MSFIYVTPNLLDADSYHSVSSGDAADAIYGPENLYNNRPSKPFRFTAKLAQHIRLHWDIAQNITHISIFNHDVTDAPGTTFQIQAADLEGNLGAVYNQDLTWQEYSLYEHLDETYKWWQIYINDPAPGTSLQIGELYFGQHAVFPNGHVQPDWSQNLKFSIAGEETYFGQNWDYYLSDCKEFNIKIKNLNNPANIDALETFFRSIGGSAGRFVFIPKENQPYCYLVKIANTDIVNNQIVRGFTGELNEWTMTLKTLVRGIKLL